MTNPLFVATFGPNDFPYMQDFSCGTGVPTGVRFAVYAVTTEGGERYKLVGAGHGLPDHYGNGAIFVYGTTKAQLLARAVEWTAVPQVMRQMFEPTFPPQPERDPELEVQWRALVAHDPRVYAAQEGDRLGNPNSLRACIILLAEALERADGRITELEAICPRKYRLPDGRVVVWQVAEDQIPLTEFGGLWPGGS